MLFWFLIENAGSNFLSKVQSNSSWGNMFLGEITPTVQTLEGKKKRFYDCHDYLVNSFDRIWPNSMDSSRVYELQLAKRNQKIVLICSHC